MAILKQRSCLTCHSLDGSVRVGPTFKGLFGQKEILVAQGKEREVSVDDARLARAIQDPMAEIVKGYPPAMPLNPLTQAELKLVIEFIRSLK